MGAGSPRYLTGSLNRTIERADAEQGSTPTCVDDARPTEEPRPEREIISPPRPSGPRTRR